MIRKARESYDWLTGEQFIQSLAEQLKIRAKTTRLHHCRNPFAVCFTRGFVSEKLSRDRYENDER